MTATEELRRGLDERGVKWTYGYGTVSYKSDGHWCNAWEYGNGMMCVSMGFFTPEQAIAATLGRGTCKIHDCEGSFSAVNRPVWRCDCGAFMTQYTDATTYHKPRYCPNCGRKVVDPTTNDVDAEVER